MYTVFYRTRDGEADYQFGFEVVDSKYRVYILSQPGYRNRDASAEATHRLTDNGRPYVCWTGDLLTLEDAKTVAAMWADATQQYCKTGRRF